MLDRLPGKEIKGYIVTTKYMYTGLKFVHGVYVLLLPIPWRAALFWVFLVAVNATHVRAYGELGNLIFA